VSVEADIVAVLQTVCPRALPDFAPFSTERPYVVYQAIGGTPLRYLDNTAADKRHTELQVTVWAGTRLAASNLIRAIEEAFCAASSLIGSPIGEAASIAEEDLNLYGSQQDFNIYTAR
jgi:hypothetical protein